MSSRAALRALFVASIIVAGCSDPSEPALPDFQVTPTTQWSGGAITIRSSYFAGRHQAPVLVAGEDTLWATPIDDSTVSAVLPLGPSQSVVISVVTGTASDSIGSVQRVGFSQKRTVTPALFGELLATDSSGAPFVLGGALNGGERHPIVRLRVVPGSAQLLPLRQPSETQYGFAPSVIPGAFTVRDSTDSIRLATLLVDVPAIVDSMHGWGTGFTRQVALLKTNQWLVTQSHWTDVRYDTGGVSALVQTESPWALYMSPRGDRTTMATVVNGLNSPGIPVWNNSTGDVAYYMPLLSSETAAFSPDGNTLYMVGGYQYSADTLVAVNATTGTLLVPKVKLPDGWQGMGVAYRDAAGGGQLLVGAATASSLVLLVYRASTLELLGVLPTDDACPDMQAGACFSGVVSVDAAHNHAYIVIPGDPTPIWTFDLLP